MKRLVTHTLIAILLAIGPWFATAVADMPPFEQFYVFAAGHDDVHTYRIPAFLVTPEGSLLVFCEARKESIRDASPTDMVLKRSTDNGRTWSPVQVLIRGRGDDAIMNPCPVVDRKTGKVVLFCINERKTTEGRYLIVESHDDGLTWTEPMDVGSQVTPYDDTFVPGPGVGIQMTSGRLVIPGCTGRWDPKTHRGSFANCIFSDDHGRSWIVGSPVKDYSNESQVVELANGNLMLNWRNNVGQSCRGTAISTDGGDLWSNPSYDRALNECPCQASIIRYTSAKQHGKNRLLFANPNVSGNRFGVVKRTQMTVRMSYDEGQTWPVKKLIHLGPSSYSGLSMLADGRIGMVYEGGQTHRREWIRFARFTLEWLTDGQDQL